MGHNKVAASSSDAAAAEEVGTASASSELLCEPETSQKDRRFLLEELTASCGLAVSEVVSFEASDKPPVAMAASRAVLYLLRLSGNRVYVGQTDHLQGRLGAHRRRFGSALEEVLVVSAGGTAQARQAESLLQRRLQRAGVALVSTSDAAHAHFGLAQGEREGMWEVQKEHDQEHVVKKDEVGAGFGDATRLRSAARYLASLADRLEEVGLDGALPTEEDESGM